MPIKVVDASAVGAMLFGEPDGPQIAGHLRENRLVAPALLHHEVASICVKKLKRHPDQRAALLKSLRIFGRLAIERLDRQLGGDG